jgi:dTDP-4-dehydrorhamnose 3,5-epimerase
VRFSAQPIDGVFAIDIDAHSDERGFFARTICAEQFAAHGLVTGFVQHSVSCNPRAGTLRGLHFQAPQAEHKLVRVTRGAVFDVVVDLRRDSASYGRWHALELTADNHRQLYIPPGVAHGFQTLLPDTEVAYAMSAPFCAAAARGLRWDDPALAIAWPAAPDRIVSARDRDLPLLDDCFDYPLA